MWVLMMENDREGFAFRISHFAIRISHFAYICHNHSGILLSASSLMNVFSSSSYIILHD